MNRLILIGNGFDLAHGMKTSYRDFINDFWNKRVEIVKEAKGWTRNNPIGYEDDFISIKNLRPTVSHGNNNDTGYKWFMNNDDFEKKEPYCTNPDNYNFTVKNSFFKKLSNNLELENWVDIETEYYNALLKIVDIQDKTLQNEEIIKLNKEFHDITIELNKYIYKEYRKSTDRSGKVRFDTTDMYRYIHHQIFSQIKLDELQSGVVINEDAQTPKKMFFLTFNYTHTHCYYSGHMNSDFPCIYIHGEVVEDLDKLNNRIPIIFGYGDDISDDYKRIESLNDNKFFENIKSFKYSENGNYKNLLQFINSDKFQIYIMGHSCGLSDRTLLNTLFNHNNCVSIKIFYHKRADNYNNILMNISRCFNQNVSMRDKVVSKALSVPLTT